MDPQKNCSASTATLEAEPCTCWPEELAELHCQTSASVGTACPAFQHPETIVHALLEPIIEHSAALLPTSIKIKLTKGYCHCKGSPGTRVHALNAAENRFYRKNNF